MKISELPVVASPTGAEQALVIGSDGGAKRAALSALVAPAVTAGINSIGAATIAAKNAAEAARDQTLATASTAQAAMLTMANLYQTVSSGLAATAPNGYFAVAGTGDVWATVYQKVSGSAVLVNILSSQLALDHVGRFVPAVLAADNSVAINAALAQASVAGVLLPAGDIRVDHAVLMQSGKFIGGAGRGVTRLVGIPGIVSETVGKAVILAKDLTGVTIRDLSVVAPKSTGTTGDKVMGTWMRNTKNFIVENVEAIDCGYAFWAQEFAQYGVFRNVRSRNANVHFETTQGRDILFDGMESDNGDGDNPLGYEGVYHTLFGSKRVTFRNGRHTGGGQALLVVADSGNGDAGLIDDILFENLRVTNTDGKIQLFVSKINAGASVGRVRVKDCDIATPGICAEIQQGECQISGGNWSTTSQEGMIAYAGTKVSARGLNWYMNAPVGAAAYIYGGDDSAPIRVDGGRVESVTDSVALAGSKNVIARNVEFVRPSVIYGPSAIGERVQYVYTADLPNTSGSKVIGAGVAGQPPANWGALEGCRYRFTLSGTARKTGADGPMYFEFDANPGDDRFGAIEVEKADGTFQRGPTSVGPAAVVNDIRQFRYDVTLTGSPGGNGVVPNYGDTGVTILKGAVVTIERIG